MLENYFEMTRKNENVNLQLNGIIAIAKTAIVRGYSFIGFGLNGAGNPSTSYKLDPAHADFPEDAIPSEYQPADFSDDELLIAKTEFRRWIIANGFSEYIHVTSIFFDKLYSALLFAECLMKQVKYQNQVKREKIFHKKMSLKDKMEAMANEMGVQSGIYSYIEGLSKMRNAMVHSAGNVTEKHINHPNGLTIKWKSMRLSYDLDQEKIDLKKGMIIPAGAEISIQMQEVSKDFPLGTIIEIAPWEIFEIFMYAQLDLDELTKSIDVFYQGLATASGAKALVGEGGKTTWHFSARRGDIEGLVR